MNWLFGSGTPSTQKQVPDTKLRVQTAVLGKPIPLICGMTRLAANLIDWIDFQSHAHQQGGGGKGGIIGGGGKGQTSTTYTYTVAALLAFCQGPIQGIVRFWNNNNKPVSFPNWGITAFLGTYVQTAWSYMTGHHPTRALTYHGLAYAANIWDLGNSPMMPNLNWELLARTDLTGAIAGQPDCDPAVWITYLLTDQFVGAGFPSANLGALTAYSNYCIATGMVVSEALVAQQALNAYLKTLLEATNSQSCWNGSTFTIVPYGDVNITANGKSYTAPSAPVVALGDDDFLRSPVGVVGNYSKNVPVTVTRKRQSDVFNLITVEYLLRSFNYNPTPAIARDDASIAAYGLRSAPVRSAHFFSAPASGLMSAHLLLGRENIRNTYGFDLDQRYIFLDPLDIVSITDAGLGLVNQWVRILSISENADSSLSFTAEEYLQGTANSPIYGEQGPGGSAPDNASAPGCTTSLAFESNLCLEPAHPSVMIVGGGSGSGDAPTVPDATKGSASFWIDPIGGRALPLSQNFHEVLFGCLSTVSGLKRGFSIDMLCQNAGGLRQFSIQVIMQGTFADSTTWNFIFATNTISLPAGPFGVGIQWDCSGASWTGKIVISGVDQTFSGSPYAAGKPILSAQAFQAGCFVYNINGESGFMGSMPPTRFVGPPPFPLADEMQLSQLWVAPGQTFDFVSNWSTFFGGGDAPANLGSDGSTPTGTAPFLYFGGTDGKSTGAVGDINVEFYDGSHPIVPATGIPVNGAYQAVGMHFPKFSCLCNISPLGAATQTWGGAHVWVSSDGGASYAYQGDIPQTDAIGYLTRDLPSHVDPDNADTLEVDLTATLGTLSNYDAADAAAGISLFLVDQELMAYTTASLVRSFTYDMTGLRRGLYDTTIVKHYAGSKFAMVKPQQRLEIPYAISQAGQTLNYKLQPFNTQGGGSPDLSTISAQSVTLAGPGLPPSPTALSLVQTGAFITLTWTEPVACGIAGFNVTIDQGGAPTALISNFAGNSFTFPAPIAGTYNIKVYAIDTLGQLSVPTVISLPLSGIVVPPFFQTNWPNPTLKRDIPAAIRAQPEVSQDRSPMIFFGLDTFYGPPGMGPDFDWPLPGRRRNAASLEAIIHTARVP